MLSVPKVLLDKLLKNESIEVSLKFSIGYGMLFLREEDGSFYLCQLVVVPWRWPFSQFNY